MRVFEKVVGKLVRLIAVWQELFVARFGMSDRTGDFPGQLVATFEPTTPYTQPFADTGA